MEHLLRVAVGLEEHSAADSEIGILTPEQIVIHIHTDGHDEALQVLHDKVEQEVEAYHVMTRTADALEGVVDGVREMAEHREEKVYSPEEYALFQLALESAVCQMDIGFEELLPEGRTTAFSAEERYSIGMEEAETGIMKIAHGIKNTILRIWDAIMAFFSELFNGFPRMIAMAKALKEKIQHLHNKSSDKEISILDAHRLSYEGHTTPESVIKGMRNVGDVGNIVYKHYLPELQKLYAEVAKPTFLSGYRVREVSGYYDAETAQRIHDAAEKLIDPRFRGEVIGGWGVRPGHILKDAKSGQPLHMAIQPPGIIQPKGKGVENAHQKMPVLDGTQMETILTQAIGNLELLKDGYRYASECAKAARAMADKFIDGMNARATIEMSPDVKALNKFILALVSVPWQVFMSSYMHRGYGAIRAAIKYCAKSYASLTHESPDMKTYDPSQVPLLTHQS